VHSAGLAAGIGAVSIINHFYGRDHVEMGAYTGEIGRPPEAGDGRAPWWTEGGRGKYVDDLLDNFASPRRNASEVPDAVSVYKRTLQDAPDSSVIVVAIGFATNLLALLNDSVGVSLVRRKFAALIVMGGRELGGFEFNYAADGWGAPGEVGVYAGLGATTYSIFSAWPQSVPVFYLPFETGVDVETGVGLSERKWATDEALESPCRRAYRVYVGESRGRSSWDPMAVLFAARGNAAMRYTIQAGHQKVSPNGWSQWLQIDNSSTANEYLLASNARTFSLASEINELLNHVPDHRPPPPPRPIECAGWCYNHTSGWRHRCDFRACAVCPECALLPVSPPPPESPPVAPPALPPPPAHPMPPHLPAPPSPPCPFAPPLAPSPTQPPPIYPSLLSLATDHKLRVLAGSIALVACGCCAALIGTVLLFRRRSPARTQHDTAMATGKAPLPEYVSDMALAILSTCFWAFSRAT